MQRIFVLLMLVSTSCAFADVPDDIGTKIDSIAAKVLQSESAVGLTIAVAQGDNMLHAKGYGFANLEHESPATFDTVYRIGSITKQFTAAAILLLVEDQKVALSDPISKHVSDLPQAIEPVTIEQLLQHTSGVKSFTNLPSYRKLMRHDVTHQDILSRIAEFPLEFTPGDKYRYSNSGYYLLGMAIESVSEQNYEAFIEQRILAPLELNQTGYDRTASIVKGRAQGYTRWGGKLRNAPYLSMTQPFAAGAMISTAGDLIQWQRALSNGELLSEESYQRMVAPGQLNDGSPLNYGLGTAIRTRQGRRSTGHGGGISGFRSSLEYFADADLTIVVLANSEQVNAVETSRRIATVCRAGPLSTEPHTPK